MSETINNTTCVKCQNLERERDESLSREAGLREALRFYVGAGDTRALVAMTASPASTLVADLRAEVERLKGELEVDDCATQMIDSIMTRTANALKGDPAPRHMHDWSDLPEVAADLRARVAELEAAAAKLLEAIGYADSDAFGEASGTAAQLITEAKAALAAKGESNAK